MYSLIRPAVTNFKIVCGMSKFGMKLIDLMPAEIFQCTPVKKLANLIS